MLGGFLGGHFAPGHLLGQHGRHGMIGIDAPDGAVAKEIETGIADAHPVQPLPAPDDRDEGRTHLAEAFVVAGDLLEELPPAGV